MKVIIVDKFALDLAVAAPGDLRSLDDDTLAALAAKTTMSIAAGSSREEQDNAVVTIAVRAKRHDHSPLEANLVRALDRWLTSDEVKAVALEFTLNELDPVVLEMLLRARYAHNPAVLASTIGGAAVLPTPARDRFVLDLGNDPDEGHRLHLLQIMGRHRRLLPPGSLEPMLEDDTCAEFVRKQAADPAAEIRERVIAVVYAWGKVAAVRDTIITLTDDPSSNVRQYALVALGTLDDDATLRLLLARLAGESQEEATSAIWALARRRDGLPHVLALLPSSRDWVTTQALGAIMYVSAPLDDAQIAELRRKLPSGDLEDSLSHHLWRTRDPKGKEVGPDGMITYVRA